MSKEQLDRFMSKWISRKLLVFFIATIALMMGNLDSSDWVTIATVYIGTQGVADIVEKVNKSRNAN
jgi:hypothetical protein